MNKRSTPQALSSVDPDVVLELRLTTRQRQAMRNISTFDIEKDSSFLANLLFIQFIQFILYVLFLSF